MTERGWKRGEGRGGRGDCGLGGGGGGGGGEKEVSFLWAGDWIAAGKNGRKYSDCQLSPRTRGPGEWLDVGTCSEGGEDRESKGMEEHRIM